MLKFVVAPDSFKGTMSSVEICDIVESCIHELAPDALVVKVPVADGGEGLVDAYLTQFGGERHELSVTGPLFQPVRAFWGMLPDKKTAVIEMASAAGLPLVEANQRNPEKTTSFGVGELIIDAASKGAEKIILGLGGSATNDGGMGMAQALGFQFLDASGNNLLPTGANLINVSGIIPPSSSGVMPDSVEIVASCDVSNKLFGPEGAAYIFGPQKGADPEMVRRLDAGLRHFSALLKTELGADVGDIAGGGAAGGLGAGVVAFTGGSLKPGVELLLDTLDFEKLIQDADYVITGEGRTDSQSLSGKTPVGIARRARRYGVPVIGITGYLGGDIEPLYQEGFTALFCTVKDLGTLEHTMLNCREDLTKTVKSIIRLILCNGSL